ncbi:MAG: hypothetical protein JNJ88_11745 [Planctomycetes bacterium]|nr:hypothetical protein [Planctomycetota bacterium]
MPLFSSSRPRCEAFLAQADDLVGRDLSPEQAAPLMEHARTCLRCARVWRASLERSAALQSLSIWELESNGVKPPAPGETADAVFARLAAGEGLPTWQERLRSQSWVRPLAAAAIVLLALSVGGAGLWVSSHGIGFVGTPGASVPDGSPALSEDGSGMRGSFDHRVTLDPKARSNGSSLEAVPVASGSTGSPARVGSEIHDPKVTVEQGGPVYLTKGLRPVNRPLRFLDGSRSVPRERGAIPMGAGPYQDYLWYSVDGRAGSGVLDGGALGIDAHGGGTAEYAGAFVKPQSTVRPH